MNIIWILFLIVLSGGLLQAQPIAPQVFFTSLELAPLGYKLDTLLDWREPIEGVLPLRKVKLKANQSYLFTYFGEEPCEPVFINITDSHGKTLAWDRDGNPVHILPFTPLSNGTFQVQIETPECPPPVINNAIGVYRK